MQGRSLLQLAETEMASAREASSGRAAATIYGGQEHDLRQTLIALVSGQSLGEHESPGEATLQVLSGDVRLTAGDESWNGTTGDHLIIPRARHDLLALSDAVVLLTVATGA